MVSAFNRMTPAPGGAPLASIVVLPKHAALPTMLTDSCLSFEFTVLTYCLLAVGLQYINLYKTVWWLPHSHTRQALNFYLVDTNLLALIVVVLTKNLVWCFLMQAPVSKRYTVKYWLLQLLKLMVLLVWGSATGYFVYQVSMRYSFVHILYLGYPAMIYVMLFKADGMVYFGLSSAPKIYQGKTGHPQHCCSLSPESIRDEVDQLKSHFNRCMKEILFNSLYCAYYCGFIPCCFTQNTLYYDVWWVLQHTTVLWVSLVVIYAQYYMSPYYCDTLHRAALHLGRWLKVEGRNAHVPYNVWSELQTWPQNALVKHIKGLFKAEALCNAAEPGNSSHTRFYFLYHEPPPFCVTPATEEQPSASVIFLHGIFQTGEKTARAIERALGEPLRFRRARVVYPTAPVGVYTASGGKRCTLWYDRYGRDIDASEMTASVDAQLSRLARIVDDEASAGRRVVVAGFSQGGAMAVHVAYRRCRDAVAGVVALSPFLNRDSAVYAALEGAAGPRPPLLVCHGAADRLIRCEWGEEMHATLSRLGVASEFRSFPDMGHEMSKGELCIVRQWIADRLGEELPSS
ncbi:PREDICTED: transmembrane protein 39A-B-like isoform X2 [Priapulus caudatus]|uniref:Transmembrane protein 39A-B-like isoform X2 n=1 Tax=Priapulus caudatus TaxID=37621 RepID=A0ABM1E8D2_PRICU|nr:PREDICTED: transmembrane protein 39A-B-like isoform X2 [Priapulus caudatus]